MSVETIPAYPTSLTFDEEMTGTVSIGGAPGEPMTFRLTVFVDDVDRFLVESEHLARVRGWVDAPSYGGRRPIIRGWFNLFVPADAPDRRLMRYRLWFTGGDGRPRTLVGIKDVHRGSMRRLWLDTSTLITRLLVGYVPDGEDEAATEDGIGTLHIRPADLAATLRSFRTGGPDGMLALTRFGRFFAGQLWDLYEPG